MLVTSYLPIQTTKIFYNFWRALGPPLWKRFRHPWPIIQWFSTFSLKGSIQIQHYDCAREPHSGAYRGGQGAQFPGRRITAGMPRSTINVTSTFFNTAHFLPYDLRHRSGGAKLASCPGRHLNLVTPLAVQVKWHVFFYSRRKSVTQNNGGFIGRPLRTAQRVLGSHTRSSEQWLRKLP